MSRRNLSLTFGATALLSFAIGCGESTQTPVSPSGAATGVIGAAPDGSTLKVTAPVPLSPKDGNRTNTTKPQLLTENARGRWVTLGLSHQFQVLDPAGHVVYDAVAPGGDQTTEHVVDRDLDFDSPYNWRVRGIRSSAVGPWSDMASFVTRTRPAAPGPSPVPPRPGGGTGPRTPDSPDGRPLGLPNMAHIVAEVAGQYPGALANSCQDHGGSWDFMDLLVDRLRTFDTRWGYNLKRGGPELSLDVIDYHWGPGPDEGSTNVYIIDVINGHCGANPSSGWNDVTGITLASGTIGRWTGRGRF